MNTDPDPQNEPDPDTVYSPSSESETADRQKHHDSSEATSDPEIDESQIGALPGTGGPDDGGDIEVDPADIHLDA